jgi:TonB family protein
VWLSRIWSARPAETARVPAIRELTDLWTGKQAQILDAFFGKLPILGPEIAAVLKQPPIILRAHFELSARPAIESDAPLVQMDQVVTELSDAPVDPSIFEVPQDYRALPPEMVRAALRMAAAKRAAAASPPPPPGGAPSSAALAGGVIGGIIGSVPVGAPPPSPVEVSPAGPVPMRIRVDGNVQQAKLIRQPKPVYPPLARQARISGVVRLRVIIAKDGTIENLTLISGHPLLVPAAMQAVKQWVYQPTLLNGEPVAVLTQVEVNFELSNSDAPANQIVNRSSGKCLGVRDGGVVQQVACEGAPFWERRPSGEIVAALSHGCLQADGSALRVDTCQGADNQQWEVRATGEILHTAGGMCLEAQGAASENKVALLSCSAGDNQKWEIGPGRP